MSMEKLRNADPAHLERAVDKVVEEKSDAAEWPDDQMQEALMDLSAGTTYKEVVGEYDDLSRKQIQRQVKTAAEHVPERDESGTPGGSPWEDPSEVAAEEFEEFMEWLGDKIGLNDNFSSTVVADVEQWGQLPSPEELGNRVDSSKSGVANGEQIRWMVKHYRSWLDDYSGSVSPFIAQETLPNSQQDNSGGAPWDNSSSWSGGGQQGGMPSAGGPGGGGPQRGGGMGGGQPAGSPQDQVLQQVMETQKEMMQEIRNLKEGGGGGGQSSLQEQLQELQEAKSLVENLQGGSNSQQESDALQMLQRQVQNLQQKLENEGQQVQTENPVQAMLFSAVKDGDMEPSEVTEIASELGVQNDPEVLGKKMEKQMKEQELEHKKERTEKMVDGLTSVASTVGEEIASAIENRQQAAQQQQGQPTQQQYQGQPAQQPAQFGGMGQQSQPATARNRPATGAADGGTPTSTATQGGDQSLDEFGDDTPSESPPSPSGDSTTEVTVEDDTESDEPKMFTCTSCGHEQPAQPDSSGFECEECDYSVQPCRECMSPMEIPAEGENPHYECPDCGEVAEEADDEDADLSCLSCEWDGDRVESPGEVAVCGDCGSVYGVRRGEVEVEA